MYYHIWYLRDIRLVIIISILLIYMCSNASLSVNGLLLVVTCIIGKLFLPGRQYDFFKGEEGHFKH